VRILFYPEEPAAAALLPKLCDLLGYEVVTDELLSPDLGVYWDSGTWRTPDAALVDLARRVPVVNLAAATSASAGSVRYSSARAAALFSSTRIRTRAPAWKSRPSTRCTMASCSKALSTTRRGTVCISVW
jgi:hypothetical protein